MKFKLDENLGPRVAALFAASGHDVSTVPQEKLSGISDSRPFENCTAERRCLVSLDLDFSDVVRFPPHGTAGVVVLRLPRGASQRLLAILVRNLLEALKIESITGRLWFWSRAGFVCTKGRSRRHLQWSAVPRWLVLSIAVAVLWGVWGALIEIPERHFSPGFPSTLGYVVWSLTMLPCALLALARGGWRIERSRAAIAYGCAVGLLGAGGQLILFRTLERGPAYLVFPIISLSPLVTIVLSLLLLRERASRVAAAGVALALVAMVLLSVQPAPAGAARGATAWLAGTLAVFVMWGVQAYFWKSSTHAIGEESMFFYMAATALLLAPFAWRMTDFSAPINWGPTGPWLTAAIQFLNALGALLIIYAFRAGKAIIVSPMINGAFPVITIVLSLLIYRRVPEFWNGLGMVLAISAILLMSYGEAAPAPTKTAAGAPSARE